MFSYSKCSGNVLTQKKKKKKSLYSSKSAFYVFWPVSNFDRATPVWEWGEKVDKHKKCNEKKTWIHSLVCKHFCLSESVDFHRQCWILTMKLTNPMIQHYFMRSSNYVISLSEKLLATEITFCQFKSNSIVQLKVGTTHCTAMLSTWKKIALDDWCNVTVAVRGWRNIYKISYYWQKHVLSVDNPSWVGTKSKQDGAVLLAALEIKHLLLLYVFLHSRCTAVIMHL